MLSLTQPVPLADVPRGTILRIVGPAGAGFPSPAQDWEDDAISLIELLLRLDQAASFMFRISGSSMIETGIDDNDVVVVDPDKCPTDAGEHRRRRWLNAYRRRALGDFLARLDAA